MKLNGEITHVGAKPIEAFTARRGKINLRGQNVGESWYEREVETARNLGDTKKGDS